MPIHDWSRVSAGTFHDFHCAWIVEMRNALNNGILPEPYYAQAEQVASNLVADVITLQANELFEGGPPAGESRGTLAVALAPPQVRYVATTEIDRYVLQRRTLVVRHSSEDRVVALIEVLSPGNKGSRHALRTFLDKAWAALAHGIHLLIIDLHPAGPRDPQGIHGVRWEEISNVPYVAPPEKPLTLAAYLAGLVTTSFIEPVAVGDALKDMPLFLGPEEYVTVPLEATYQAAWRGVPRRWRAVLELPPA